jgi:type I restriction enzyme S subunit
MFKAESYAGHKLCWPGDLVINSLWAWGRGLGVAQHHGIVSTAYGVYRQHGDALNADYLHQLVRSEPFQWELQVRSQGVWKSRLQITDDRWLDAPLLVPAHEEQAAIVKYLAHANARIDKAISAKRRLISLLAEQNTSTLRALIVGEEYPGARKSSGLHWVGGLPADWEVRKLRSLFARQGSGTTPSGEGYYGGGRPWIMSGDLNDAHVSSSARTVTTLALEEVSSLREHPAGSLVIAMYGATIGRTGILEMSASTNQACSVLSDPKSDVNVAFVQLAMLVGRPALQELGAGGGQPNVNAEKIAQFRIPLPPLTEQKRIVREYQAVAAGVDLIRGKAEREIMLLQEFRTRLVADVVTGQVDVRAIAATLPDAPESFDNTVSATDDDVEDVLGQGEE